MNEHRKSDRPVVPAKFLNKPGQPTGAEGVEGRGLAKGNLSQQNTERIQSREENVPSALERVRQAAKRDKTIRFTSLMHHIYNLDTLREAYDTLKLARDAGAPVLAYGAFVNSIVEFLIVAFSIFLVVRQINRLRGPKKA